MRDFLSINNYWYGTVRDRFRSLRIKQSSRTVLARYLLSRRPSALPYTGDSAAEVHRPATSVRTSFAASTLALGAIATVVLMMSQTSAAAGSSAITLRSIATGSTSTQAAHVTVNRPQGVAPGDIMLAQVAVRGGAGQILTPPAGWSLIRRDADPTMILQGIYTHVVGPSEPVSYTWNFDAGNDAAAAIADFGGVNTITPIDSNNGQANPSSTNIVAPSVTIPGGHNQDLLIGMFAISNASAIAVPRGTSMAWSFAAIGYGIGIAMSDVNPALSGPSGTWVAAAGSARPNVGALVALVPLNAMMPTATLSPGASPTPRPTGSPTSHPTSTPSPKPASTPLPSYFSTLPPNSTVPGLAGEGACAAGIPVTAETIASNAQSWSCDGQSCPPANWTLPDATTLNQVANDTFFETEAGDSGQEDAIPYMKQVTGNYASSKPSTDMIIRWASCKWGLDENAMRAEAVVESNWHQTDDFGDSSSSECTAGGGVNLIGLPGASPSRGGCWRSFGLFQIMVVAPNYNAWDGAWKATPFDADYRAAFQRACMDGKLAGYMQGQGSSQYAAYTNPANAANTGYMFWGCMGEWYSGGWYDSGAQDYISQVEQAVSSRSWIGLQ